MPTEDTCIEPQRAFTEKRLANRQLGCLVSAEGQFWLGLSYQMEYVEWSHRCSMAHRRIQTSSLNNPAEFMSYNSH